ncbi:paraquat-inducible protein A [Noviherbaspirillum massiliense]|uniref:paraquat-inducible protein A n=1 Tax=Noviherbaspirillum massiliense TaxID=1465823 RepID=UPI0002EB5449|nr:paraquat-inducible protein A [Noviherbaspirillum massiliense]
MDSVSAASLGLVSCPVCSLLCRTPGQDAGLRCPRCRSSLHFRKPNSVARTWALVITAYILYIPANLLPILETRSLFESQRSTILNGVILFWNTGSWFIAALIFFASIVVPLTKLMALTLLLVSVQRRTRWEAQQRTQLYRFVDFIGRWSMLDIYVVALSVALVHLEALATMRAGLGAVAFGAVVVLTMLAVETFDPRLIWDSAREQNG